LLEKGIGNIFWHYNTWGTGTNILGWPAPSMGPFSVPMWFLQTLIVLTILTPVIYLICKYLKKYGMILLGLLYYTGIWFSIPGFSISAVFFFSLGAYFGIHKKHLTVELKKYKLFWYLIAFLTLLPSVYYDYDGLTTYNYFSPIFILAMVISAINITSFLIEERKMAPNHTLSKATFFIYAIHTVLVLSIIGLIFDIIFKSRDPIILIIRYFTVPIATAYVCVLIYCIMKIIMPKMLNLLSGNR
jgi:heme/copper-type cytochrome/quinol oxidase subunit 4